MLAMTGRRAAALANTCLFAVYWCGCGAGFEEDPPPGPSKAGWSKSFGDDQQQTITGVAVDDLGGVYITGGFTGFTDFGDGAKEAAGQSEDLFVAKYDTDGNHVWSRRFGDTGNQRGTGIALGPGGEVIVTGFFGGAIDIAGQFISANDGADSFIVVLTRDGEEDWGTALSGSGFDQPRTLAVDRGGNIIVAGTFRENITLGPETYVTAGEDDIFVVKLLPTGELVWSRQVGGIAADVVSDITTDSDGNIALTGYVRDGIVDFGGGPTDPVGATPNDDAFVVALGPDGVHRWSKRLGDDNVQAGFGASYDANDELLIIGHFGGTIDFGGESRTSSGNYDVYLAKLDATGGPVWTKRFGVMSNQYGYGVGTDPSLNVFVTGDFEGVIEFGGQELQSAGGRDIYFARLDSESAHTASTSFGDDIEQSVADIAVDSGGSGILVGNFYGTIDFGFGAHSSTGDMDQNPFIAKLAQ